MKISKHEDLISWSYGNQLNTSSTGYTYLPQSGICYYVGGSNISADYLFQRFPTQIGHLYEVTRHSMYLGYGSFSIADLFLGV